MDIRELKNKIETKTITDDPLILKYEDNSFICDQYANAIADIRNLKTLRINSLSDITNDEDMFGTAVEYLYIYDVEKLQENVTAEDKNLIVICKNLPDNLTIDYIDIPKIIPWQIEDYVKMRLPGLNENQIKWLCDISKYDIYRLNNECKKLEIFTPATQDLVFGQLNNENAYCDLNSLTIFNFTNAVMKKDLNVIHNVLTDLKYIDIEGSGLITIFHSQFKRLIDIQFNPRATAESLGMNPKQFNAIKYNVGRFTNDQLVNIFEFITGLDQRLKSGDFQFKLDNRENNNKFVEYITLNILALCK